MSSDFPKGTTPDPPFQRRRSELSVARATMGCTLPTVSTINTSLEVGIVACSRAPTGDAMIVHVVHHPEEDDLDRFLKKLRDFRDFATDYARRKVYGIIAIVDASDDLREKVLREGIYLASIHDDRFEIQVPESFQPRAF